MEHRQQQSGAKLMAYNIKEEQAHEEFLAHLDIVTIAGIEFDCATILKEMDPIAYDQEFANFCDAMGFDFDEENESNCRS